jgi:lipid II:glycine glycyltransferase (peptidoglycan interpeptide bridge formation enzyme)
MLQWLKAEGLKRKVIFIKLEPNYITNVYGLQTTDYSKDKTICHPEFSSGSEILKQVQNDKAGLIKLLTDYDCVRGKTLFTPTTFQIDLTKSEEEIFKSFSSKTRYNIRLAQKHKVIVQEDNSNEAFESYIKLMRETVERQGFYAHTEKYHRLMWNHLSGQPTNNKQLPTANLLTATYNHEVIAAWILFQNDGVLYYPYGASTEKHKEVMASSLMMWEAIRFGKKLGCHTFDLWGREEGKGFTRFKEGFNPKVIEFLGTWDLVISKPIYNVYRVLEYLRWRVLRLQSKFTKPSF